MDGVGPRAGAVAGVRHVKNPIGLARLIMDKSPYVMLIGEGAEEFAREQALEFVPNTYFRTPYREQELQRAIQRERQSDPGARAPGTITGTVGAVALDRAGNLAAATSTGGTTNKRYGRVGDSPIIGAGTYANNESCAVSATGTGEFFIRSVVAYDIHALVQYKQLSLADAAKEVVQVKLKRAGGDGGIIAIDRTGQITLEFNCQGMFRGARDSRGRREVAIY
jgi:beta-aspartyl-peptidase (threonine type)